MRKRQDYVFAMSHSSMNVWNLKNSTLCKFMCKKFLFVPNEGDKNWFKVTNGLFKMLPTSVRCKSETMHSKWISILVLYSTTEFDKNMKQIVSEKFKYTYFRYNMILSVYIYLMVFCSLFEGGLNRNWITSY